MQFLPEFLTVAAIHLLAVMSPGPDFVMVCKNSLSHSRKIGIYSAIGLGFGILVHVAYSLVGIGFVISRSILLFTVMKFLGAGYLIFIGYKALRSKSSDLDARTVDKSNSLGRLEAVRMGLLTNALNPKATLFFLALFTQVIDPQTPKTIQIMYGLEMSLMTFVWFALVATLLSNEAIKRRFASVQHRLEKFLGAILIALGLKIALSTR